jgi:hypothetical protein
MNRQARVVINLYDARPTPITEWDSYGNVNFFAAVRQHALANTVGSGIVSIETRDADSLEEGSKVYVVEVTREARILNPRLDTDWKEKESANLLSRVWNLILGRYHVAG